MKIGVVGCGGRMGQAVIQAVYLAEGAGAGLAAACDRPGFAGVGQDAGILAGINALAVTISDSPEAVFAASDVVIDFTTPEATARHAALAVEHRKALVIGTTGHSDAEKAVIRGHASKIPMVWASNYSTGVNTLFWLTRSWRARVRIVSSS